MRHFMRSVERIDVDEHAAGFENAECDDRIGAKWIELQILPRISLSRPNTRSLPVRGIRSPKIKMAAPSLKPANDVIHVSKLLSA
jgi:hypothetical protein